MRYLRARLLRIAQDAQARETADARRSMVGSGERSEKIRTYNFPEGRVTDHRIRLTTTTSRASSPVGTRSTRSPTSFFPPSAQRSSQAGATPGGE